MRLRSRVCDGRGVGNGDGRELGVRLHSEGVLVFGLAWQVRIWR